MSSNQGAILKSYLKGNSINIADFAAKLNISRAMMYLLFEKQFLDSVYQDKIKAILGEDIFNIDSGTDEQVKGYPSDDVLKKSLGLLSETIKMMQEMIDTVQKDNKVFRAIVEMGVKEGAISFNQKSKKS